jgi:hypothetical protein
MVPKTLDALDAAGKPVDASVVPSCDTSSDPLAEPLSKPWENLIALPTLLESATEKVVSSTN